MAGVSVQSQAVQSGIACCKVSIHELESASRSLLNSYQQAGAGWQDKKYYELGGIVEECCSALKRPVADLQDCMSKLNELLQAISEFEEVSF